ncbi:MAG: ribose ABC transporter permease [Lachnospiraceae bacterium]|jgi:ribose transport system permease protein|uniref:ABC transporter permease n=1 Tax=Candidatus Merdisoma sp. JLR.KK011 TaxID=3114299 RepID=UPI00143492CF|nr:ribose ABC transporter permease [Lachnospiraceae bacterium]MCI9018380.1 ribose ABC transporter permease [Lachnospiraceae bacterium]MCI9252841.1 ribose ABC transporter permease [Lachnospiraceae bacterium]MCI9306102.1 ribose ABC transporter permease [Lachnospiraceae bacterium]MCI9479339.1 ribose ABC transporter permease [Lachnospiraceae bacterium]
MAARLKNGIVRYFKDNIGIIIALLVMCIFLVVFPTTRATFLTPKNVFNILRQNASNLFLATGMTMVIILGGIELSVGSVIALSGVVAAGCVINFGLPEIVGFLAAIGVGALVGMFNGFVICKTDIPPFIVTLASMNITKGIALVLTGGSPIRCMTDTFKFPGAGYVGPVPTPVILMIIVFIIAAFMINRTQLGRHIYAVGGNAQAAKFSGINVQKVKFIVYTYTGIMSGIAGLVVASRLYSGQPTAGDGAEMDAIAAVVVGGTSMSGGSGRLGGTLIGVLIIGVLNNGLNLLGVDSNWQYIVKGLVILLAVYVDFIRNKKAGR